jgi:hypothetical protein
MAYDEDLAERIRAELADADGVVEKRMFGGLAFLVDGNMAVSASGQGGLLVRCAPGATAGFLDDRHVHRFEMRGRGMDGWLRVDAAGVVDDADLRRWIDVGVAYARSLPAK